MSRGPQTDFIAKARAAWGDTCPDWVETLAEACNRRTASAVAQSIKYSPAVVSHVLANRYPGDIKRVEEKVRGALMGETVQCPVLGDLPRHRCLDEQKKPNNASSSIRSRIFRACRAGCPNSRLKGD